MSEGFMNGTGMFSAIVSNKVKIVCGLGNPGSKYEQTRHNIGWLVADRLAASLSLKFTLKAGLYYQARGAVNDETIVIIKPVCYMNNSGKPVCHILSRTGLSIRDLIVIHDDLDLAPGRLKLKINGGHGGHNGIRSICALTGLNDFVRIRIGIGRDSRMNAADYVLSRFKRDERVVFDKAVENATEAVYALIQDPVLAMNRFNQDVPSVD